MFLTRRLKTEKSEMFLMPSGRPFQTKDNRKSARDTNETNELKRIVRVREILTKQTN